MKKLSCILVAIILLGSLVYGCQIKPQMQPSLPSTTNATLNLYGIDPITLDPAVCSDRTSYDYVMQIFGGLVRLDEKLEPVPDVAGRWAVSNGGKTYTFYLRHDVKFADGKSVKAGDFKYSWERAASPQTKSLDAVDYLGDIVGVKEVLAGSAKEISGVKVVNDYTLQVTLADPDPYFLLKLSYPVTFVVEKANVQSGADWWVHPVGTGPFKLKQWDKENLFVLEKNPLYYGEKAKVDSVAFHLWAGIPMDLYETGKIDVADVSFDYIDKVTDNASPLYKELTAVSELGLSYIGFNTAKPPFDDQNIRLAFAHAIDRDKIISLIFKDKLTRADGILPASMPGYSGKISGLNFDINKARELIKSSKYGDVSKLPPITITTVGWGSLIETELEAIVYQWRENLGVEVKVRQLEPKRFFYNLKDEKNEMFFADWTAYYPHPQALLGVLFHTGAAHNSGGYSNPAVDITLDTGSTEQNPRSIVLGYHRAEQILGDDAAAIPLWFDKTYLLVKPYVKGYERNALGQVMLNKVVVEGR